jgi:hypothetical protein
MHPQNQSITFAVRKYLPRTVRKTQVHACLGDRVVQRLLDESHVAALPGDQRQCRRHAAADGASGDCDAVRV